MDLIWMLLIRMGPSGSSLLVERGCPKTPVGGYLLSALLPLPRFDSSKRHENQSHARHVFSGSSNGSHPFPSASNPPLPTMPPPPGFAG